MIAVNYLAVVVATIVVFVVSSVYYVLFSRQAGRLSAAWADTSRPPAWRVAQEPVRTLVTASVVAGLAARLGIAAWAGALQLALALWVAFPVVLLAGSVIYEKVPWRLATIHAGDWLLKLLVLAVVVSVWR
jgi:Protein of unknown function (DUF1761)